MVLLLLLLFSAGCNQGPPTSTQALPTYPGATGVTERELDASDAQLNIYRAVAFTTTDAATTVLSFYKDALTKDDWQLDPFQPDPNGLTFKWSTYDQPPVTYLCIVTTRPGDGGNTEVEVELRYNPGS
jgi:hypothetical protein